VFRNESFSNIIKPISMKKLILPALLLTLGLTAANAQRHDGLGDLPAWITTKMTATVARVGHRINRKVYHRQIWARAYYTGAAHRRHRSSGLDRIMIQPGHQTIIVVPRSYTWMRKEVQ
jgi:hypothetical protein